MKKKVVKKVCLSVIAVLLAVIICFGSYLLYRFNCDKSGIDDAYFDSIYSSDSISLNTSDDVFRILKINDTHLFNGTCENDVKTLESIDAVLQSNPCDLILVEGDLAEGFNLNMSYDKFKAVEQFADVIESYNIPWTFAPGNNDGEIDGSNNDVIKFMRQYAHFVCGNKEGVDGALQLFIDIKRDDKLVHSIAVLDSHSRKIKAVGSYDYIKQSQIDWLEDGIAERKINTSVFFHMPTPKFKEAYEKGEVYKDFFMADNNNYAEIEENELFDDAFDDNAYIGLISCAHQHGNNMCSYYNGRYYQLSTVSGFGAGRPDSITPSCTLISIDTGAEDTESMYEFEQIEFDK